MLCKPQIYLHFQASTNGFISFEQEIDLNSFAVREFPRPGSSLSPMIAPLWADFNFRDGGTLFYRVTGKLEILDAITKKLGEQNSEYLNYRPKQAVIVTWFQGRLLDNNTQIQVMNACFVIIDKGHSEKVITFL